MSELDDWCVLQHDMQIDGGIVPVEEKAVLQVRERAAMAIKAVIEALDFAPVSDSEAQAAITAFSSADMPDRDKVADLEYAQKLPGGPLTAALVREAADTYLERGVFKSES